MHKNLNAKWKRQFWQSQVNTVFLTLITTFKSSCSCRSLVEWLSFPVYAPGPSNCFGELRCQCRFPGSKAKQDELCTPWLWCGTNYCGQFLSIIGQIIRIDTMKRKSMRTWSKSTAFQWNLLRSCEWLTIVICLNSTNTSGHVCLACFLHPWQSKYHLFRQHMQGYSNSHHHESIANLTERIHTRVKCPPSYVEVSPYFLDT